MTLTQTNEFVVTDYAKLAETATAIGIERACISLCFCVCAMNWEIEKKDENRTDQKGIEFVEPIESSIIFRVEMHHRRTK